MLKHGEEDKEYNEIYKPMMHRSIEAMANILSKEDMGIAFSIEERGKNYGGSKYKSEDVIKKRALSTKDIENKK